MTAQSLQSGVTVDDDSIKSEECHLPPLPVPLNFPCFFFALVLTFVQQLTITRRSLLIRTRPSDAFMRIQLFRETFSEKVHATIAKGIIVDGFWVHYSSEKFERMAREALDVRLRVLNESNKSRFDS